MILRTFCNRSLEFMKFAWKTYIQPILDYASQVWAPIEGGLLYKLESLLKSFSSKIDDIGHLHYWERLGKMRIYSINRRYERYRIMYCHKIIQGMTPNCNLTWSNTPKYGHIFSLTEYGNYENSNRKQSFHFMGPRLYNSIPVKLRPYLYDMNFAQWKTALDKFLSEIPDHPVTGPNETGLCEHLTSKQTNSLLYWIPFLGKSGRRGTIEVTYL